MAGRTTSRPSHPATTSGASNHPATTSAASNHPVTVGEAKPQRTLTATAGSNHRERSELSPITLVPRASQPAHLLDRRPDHRRFRPGDGSISFGAGRWRSTRCWRAGPDRDGDRWPSRVLIAEAGCQYGADVSALYAAAGASGAGRDRDSCYDEGTQGPDEQPLHALAATASRRPTSIPTRHTWPPPHRRCSWYARTNRRESIAAAAP